VNADIKMQSLRVYCSVYGCKNFYSKKSNINFHWFPKADKSKILWKNKNGSKELVDRRRAREIQLRMGKETEKTTKKLF